ncbi:unnamed protein product, partial [Didymodactylos carnosus]
MCGSVWLETNYNMFVDDWRKDGIQWCSRGRHVASVNQLPVFETFYFISEDSLNGKKSIDENLSKKAYVLIANPLKVLVQYMENVSNGIKQTKLSTPQSVLNVINQMVERTDPKIVYDELIATKTGVQTVRNAKQVEYRRRKYLQKTRLNHAELYSTYRIGLANDNFVRDYTICPLLTIICAHIFLLSRILERFL